MKGMMGVMNNEKNNDNIVGKELPLKPKESFDNFRNIDDELSKIIGAFWGFIWGRHDSAIGQKTKLLLSLSNAVGAGRLRQATRELIKAYAIGVSVAELDELFSLFIS